MRYLNTYKVFENTSDESVIQYLNDICQGLKDMGYNVQIFRSSSNYDRKIIKVYCHTQTPFSPTIKDAFEMAISYMKSEGYGIGSVQYLGNLWRVIPSEFRGEKYLEYLRDESYFGYYIAFNKIN